MAVYAARPDAGAVVHLHSTYATLLSCLADTDPEDAIPPLTPYVVMRVGRVPVLPYVAPGDPAIAPLIRASAADGPALLLANHGPVVAGATLEAAVFAAEELEETAKLAILGRGLPTRLLEAASIARLAREGREHRATCGPGMTGPRLFVVAGEPSGDLLGGALLAGLHALAGPGLAVEGVGGPMMAAQGLASRFPMEELSVMGLAEVLPRVPNLWRRIRETADAVAAAAPDALVTIDSPDFNLRVARRARRLRPELKVIHYVAPSVWAWRPGRAAKMAEVVDHVLALLPFEPPYMEAAGMTCDFVGHPVAAEPQATPAETAALRAELAIAPDQPLLALLPGSRRGEVTRLAPVFAEVTRRLRALHPELAVIVPAAPPVAALLDGLDSVPTTPAGRTCSTRAASSAEAWAARKRAAFGAADAALAASGTVSLELAAAGTPMVIAYDASALTNWMVRRMVRVDTATLVNLVTETRAVPEFLFDDCTAESHHAGGRDAALRRPAAAAAQRAAGERAMQLLGRGGEPPGLRAARSVLAAISR